MLLPNRREAQALTGVLEPEAALSKLRKHARTVVIKLDQDGCIASDGGEVEHASAPAIPIVNATGAGDAFDAGFPRTGGQARAWGPRAVPP